MIAGFSEQEADAWFRRNREKLQVRGGSNSCPVLRAIQSIALRPKKVLEVGAANGWRLDRLHRDYGSQVAGVDLSAEAVAAGREAYPNLDIRVASATALPYQDETFDMLILGFFLYLVDRSQLFRIAAESDRVLANGGVVVVYDFCVPGSYRNPYAHAPGVFSYKMDYSRLFAWDPAYREVYRLVQPHPGLDAAQNLSLDDQVGVIVLRKSIEDAYPLNPYR